MPTLDLTAKEANLARIRENQRRCRARRREYIAELEHKLQASEQTKIQASIEIQTTAQKLARENQILKDLLKSVGFDDKFQDSYIKAELERGETARSEPLPLAQASDSSPLALTDTTEETNPDPQLTSTFPNEPFPPIGLYNTTQPLSSVYNVEFSNFSPDILCPPNGNIPTCSGSICQQSISSTHDSSQTQPSLSPYGSLNDIWARPDLMEAFTSITATNPGNNPTGEETTLCSVAYNMVMKHNKKRYNEVELNIRLCRGFKTGGNTLEGCRVENRVLFSVLAEIS